MGEQTAHCNLKTEMLATGFQEIHIKGCVSCYFNENNLKCFQNRDGFVVEGLDSDLGMSSPSFSVQY